MGCSVARRLTGRQPTTTSLVGLASTRSRTAYCVKRVSREANARATLAQAQAAREVAAAEQAAEQAREEAAYERDSRIAIEEQWAELRAELLVAKGREEGLQYALQRAYGCKCMKL